LLPASFEHQCVELDKFVAHKKARVKALREQLEVEECALALLERRRAEVLRGDERGVDTTLITSPVSINAPPRSTQLAVSAKPAHDSGTKWMRAMRSATHRTDGFVDELLGYLEQDFARLFSP